MKIKWLGHSCFLIETQAGTKVLHDPYKNMLGYKLPEKLKVDYVVTSHEHSDHNYTEGLDQRFTLVNNYGETKTAITTFNGVLTYHDQVEGDERGDNAMFTYVVDGLRLTHLGDLGHELTAKQLEAVAGTDILFLPVGGGYTIDGKTAAAVANQINPTVVIPMHYRTRALGPFGLKFEKVTNFTKVYNKTVNKTKELTVSEASIKNLADVIVMNYR